uniref:Glycosyltransferase 2-like domain-containing protein n=1 Tax=uncultured Desulfobacterium sp. TaxID=201089 RepID=E1YIE4_9BACT|nr:hypothetical protein N47_D28000 [uncultured Desulfobacterium sp.]
MAIDYDAKIRRIFSDLGMEDRVVSYDDIELIPSLVREKMFPADRLAQREKVNDALVALICADIRNEPRPSISVVMPTYNRSYLLQEAIDSLVTQTVSDWELILIDDGSIDDTAGLISAYQDSRIKYYNFGHNGISYSRNIGNLLSRGEIIAIADSDDINLPNRLEIVLNKMLESGADIFYSAMFHFTGKGQEEIIPSYPFLKEHLRQGNYIYHPTVAYRREIAIKLPYDESLEMVEDYDFYLRASDRGCKFYHEEQPLVMHRIHEKQISMERSNEMESIHEKLVRSQSISAKVNDSIKQPLVSVIIPTFNRPEMLKEAIKSVMSQTYGNFEIIVINDAGTDVSNIINSFNGDKRIIYLQHPENKGLAASRNTAIRASHGKYIACLDDDDIYYPEHLETLIGFLESSDYKVAYTDANQVVQTWNTDRYVTTHTEMIYSHDFNRDNLLISNYIPVLSLVYRRDLLSEAGLFDESLGTHEDWELLIRLSRRYDFFHIKKITAEFRIRDDDTNMTDTKRADFLKTLKIIYQRYSHLITDVNLLEAQKNTEEYLAVDVAIRQIPSKELFRQVERYIKKKDLHINDLGTALRDKDAMMKEKDVHIGNLDSTIEEKNIALSANSEALMRIKAELNEVYQSTSWRITKPLRFIKTIFKNFIKNINLF